MTKRPNPFDDHGPMQLKMHIGTKEVDQGVESELRMKQVYERTKALMYENRVFAEDDSDHLTNGHRNDTCSKSNSTGSKYKQLCLDAFGQLQRNTSQSPASSSGGEPSSSSCPSCLKPISLLYEKNSKCSFCEKVACDGCLKRCFNCNCDFCSLCSLQIYDRSEDKSVCLSCSTT